MPEHHWACRHLKGLRPLQGGVLSGHKEALQQVQCMAGALKVAPQAVSGAFHTPHLQTAQDNFKQASHKSAIPFVLRGAQTLQTLGAEKHTGCKSEALADACMLQGLYVCSNIGMHYTCKGMRH